LILQYVVRGKFLWVHTLQAQDLDAGAGETALGRLGGALHEEDYWGRGDSLVDGLADGIGEEPALAC
jgi:hypothetical protein